MTNLFILGFCNSFHQPTPLPTPPPSPAPTPLPTTSPTNVRISLCHIMCWFEILIFRFISPFAYLLAV